MCLILFAYRHHGRYPLVIAANRDEYYERPSAPAAFWSDFPDLLAGRDVRAGGTWLGVTKSGRIAAVTNFRDPQSHKEHAPSRGRLLADYLCGDEGPNEFIERILPVAKRYNGFSIIVGDILHLYCFSNVNGFMRDIEPGIHGLSNHLIDTPWPKVVRGKEMLDTLLSQEEHPSVEAIFNILADTTWPDDSLLPDTGVGLERERRLSPLFIASPDYGTRSSTVILADGNHTIKFAEKTFDPGTLKYETRVFELNSERI
jgi:uncharacterized protein with NRDE domain